MMKRWNSHVYTANRIKDGKAAVTSHFPNAIRKYGKDAFSHEVLETCGTLEEANLAEEKWIAHFDTRDPEKGFNLAKGGGCVPNPEKRNPWDDPAFRAKMEATALPRFIAAGLSPEARAASRAALATPEGKAALSRGVSRHYEDPGNRARQSASVAALHRDPEIHASFQNGLRTADANKRARTRCKNGHEFTPENTRVDAKGWRYCRRCAADRASKKSRDARIACSKGHPFAEGSFTLSSDGRRVCSLCVITHCRRGHEFTPENTRVDPKRGVRYCLECRRARGRVSDAGRRQRRREENRVALSA